MVILTRRIARLRSNANLSLILFAVAIAALSIVGSASAEKGRVLGGYRFVPSTRVQDPFITSYFRNATGLSIASDVDVPILIIDTDTLLSLSGDLLFVGASFEYQHAVGERVAVGITAGGLSRVGTSGESIISQGVSALFSTDLKSTIELWRGEDVLLSGLVGLGFGNVLVIDLVQFAEDIINNGPENASILTMEDGVTVDGGVAAAWALNHWAGLTALGQIGYSNIGSQTDELLWRLAATGTVDFGQNDKAPIGLLLWLDVDRLGPKTIAGGTANAAGIGVFYTGREDLNLGVEIGWSRFRQLTRDITINPVNFAITLRYYF